MWACSAASLLELCLNVRAFSMIAQPFKLSRGAHAEAIWSSDKLVNIPEAMQAEKIVWKVAALIHRRLSPDLVDTAQKPS